MPRTPPFKVRMGEWIEAVRNRMLSEKSVIEYRGRIGRAYKYAKEHDWPMNPAKVEPRHIRQYYESLQHLGLSTQRDYVTCLLQFLKWAGNRKLDDVRIRIRPARTRVNWLTEEQVGMMVQYAGSPEQRAMVVLLAYTGMRVSELTGLREKDVRESEILIRGKGGRARTIPVDREFWDLVSPYHIRRSMQNGAYYMLHRDGRPYSSMAVYHIIVALGRKLNLHSPPHTLRRSFGRHLYMNGCPLAQLATLMGHASIDQTIMYLGLGQADIQTAIEKYRPHYAIKAQKLYHRAESQASD